MQPPDPVRRRHTFFLSGFDPKGSSHYHALYRGEAQRQSRVSGMRLEVGPRRRSDYGDHAWDVQASDAGRSTDTTIEFLRWDDLVRKHWPRSVGRLLLDVAAGYAQLLGSGKVPTVWALSRKTLIALAYPVVFLLAGLLLSLMLAWAAATLTPRLVGPSAAGVGTVAALAALASLAGGLWLTSRLERRLNTTWLVRIFRFTGRQARGQLPDLEQRLEAAAHKIATALRSGAVDEVLVVGYSVGSILSVSAVARALRLVDGSSPLPNPEPAHGPTRLPTLSLMTLGHCIPMLGLLPDAKGFRAELAAVADAAEKPASPGTPPRLTWIDFSSPTDWGSFPLVDPVSASEAAAPDRPRARPLLRSPRFHTQFAPPVYAQLSKNKRRMHLQYLMAAELPADYDYFAITAGPLRLDQRFPAPVPSQPG